MGYKNPSKPKYDDDEIVSVKCEKCREFFDLKYKTVKNLQEYNRKIWCKQCLKDHKKSLREESKEKRREEREFSKKVKKKTEDLLAQFKNPSTES